MKQIIFLLTLIACESAKGQTVDIFFPISKCADLDTIRTLHYRADHVGKYATCLMDSVDFWTGKVLARHGDWNYFDKAPVEKYKYEFIDTVGYSFKWRGWTYVYREPFYHLLGIPNQ